MANESSAGPSSSARRPKRRYEKRRRAERERETRERITAAAVELHETVGPARTTISELADRAGVQRATVYRHFPDERSLFDACSGHWIAANPPPDFEPWRAVADPERRLRTALAEYYAYYRAAEPMLANITRDAEALPALAEVTARRTAHFVPLTELLTEGWEGGDHVVRRAAISLALDFRTWRMLVRERGLTDAQAVELMVRAVR